MGTIDAHSHLWTPDTEKYPLAKGYTKRDMKPPSWTPEQFWAAAKPEGVDRVVAIQMSFYGFDNSYMLDCMAREPGKIGGVAVIDWTGPKPDEDMKKMADHKVRGFRVYPKDAPIATWMQTPSFDRMFLFAADRKLVICPLIDARALPSLSRMCAKYPHTRIVIDHLCRIGIDGDIRQWEVDALCEMAQYPEVRVKVSAFYALGKKKPPHDDLEPLIKRVHAAFGAKRLMWASDCPFAVDNERYRDAISLVRDGCPWLGKEDRKWLFEKTAEQIFF
jgi:predicted TIM-barrel fold metal-dependent hydrolase